MYRESTAVPMIVAGPDVTAGRVCNTTVNLIDAYPTIIESMGLDVAHDERDLPGKSLFEIASVPDDGERIGFSEYHAVGATSGTFMLIITSGFLLSSSTSKATPRKRAILQRTPPLARWSKISRRPCAR